MKIAILSLKESQYSVTRLREAGEARGHEIKIVDYLRCYMGIAAHKPAVMSQGGPLENFDAVIPRIDPAHTFYGTAVIRQFEMMEVMSANSSQGIARAADKLRTLQLLSREGIGLPVTGFAHSTKDVDGLIDMVGGAPLVIKILEGTQGIRTVLAETRKVAATVIEAFRGLNVNILVQEYVRGNNGKDIRCIVVGGKVAAAMLSPSTLKLGDAAPEVTPTTNGFEKIKLTPEERSTAIRAAKVMGLNIAGVDILRANHGAVVIDINSAPDLETIETVTGNDVANKIVEFLEKDAET